MIPVCPKCDVGLFILHFRSVEVDYCERCRGVWLDAGEFETLMEVTGATPSDPLAQFHTHPNSGPGSAKHLCPRCDRALHEIVVDGPGGATLTLDRCPRGHGLWFDADELQQLLAMYPPASGASKAIGYLNELFGAAPKT